MSSGFIEVGQELRFGHHTTNRTVLWDNDLALGGDARTIRIGSDDHRIYIGDDGSYRAGTKQRLANLHIEGRGTIEWRGGEVGLASILWINSPSFSSSSDILFIRNWYEYEDFFLVRREGFHSSLLPQIIFEGYQDYDLEAPRRHLHPDHALRQKASPTPAPTEQS